MYTMQFEGLDNPVRHDINNPCIILHVPRTIINRSKCLHISLDNTPQLCRN
jgi:hypothetical protein